MSIKFNKLFVDERTRKFAIGARDIIFSMYYTIGGTVSAAAYQAFSDGRWPTKKELALSAGIGITVGFQHILRKFFTGPSNIAGNPPASGDVK
jgi:hypothetical protein